MAEPSAPILVFDSGVGGLTILAEVRKTLPQAPVIYAADFAGLPYGTKSEAEVAARVCGLLGRMAERYQPRLICIACNTASTIALSMVRDVLEVPIVGTVPAIKPAALVTQTGVIGLLGTGATVRQPYVDRLAQDLDTLVLACTHFPLLADELRAVFGEHVQLVDGSQGIARRIASLTQGQDFAREGSDFAVATGSAESLTTLTPMLERHGLMHAAQF